jgi:hypothetical protein
MSLIISFAMLDIAVSSARTKHQHRMHLIRVGGENPKISAAGN